MSEERSEEARSQEELLKTHRTTLAHYLEQQAKLGSAHIGPGIAHGIIEARNNIRQIKRLLKDWGVDVADYPDDEPSSSISLLSGATAIRNVLNPALSNVPAISFPARPIGMLYVTSGKDVGSCYFMTEAHRMISVGRHTSCDVRLSDTLVSPKHLKISIRPISSDSGHYRDYSITLSDWQSRNGTFVSGREANGDPFPLKTGDVIQLGSVSIVFHRIVV
jgi:hypothetical protein